MLSDVWAASNRYDVVMIIEDWLPGNNPFQFIIKADEI